MNGIKIINRRQQKIRVTIEKLLALLTNSKLAEAYENLLMVSNLVKGARGRASSFKPLIYGRNLSLLIKRKPSNLAANVAEQPSNAYTPEFWLNSARTRMCNGL